MPVTEDKGDTMGDRPRAALAIDIGGTFTDVVLVDGDGRLYRAKPLTLPADPISGALVGVRAVLEQSGVRPEDVERTVHGTTLATNVVLERKGAPLAFVTTQGFRTAFGLGHYARHESERYDLMFEAPEPPVPLSHCFEVPERVGASGEVLVPLDEAATAEVIGRIAELGVASVAISLLHSYANPAHEQRVAAMCRERLPGVVVVASHETWPEIREYERASTTVVSAYVGPIMAAYLAALEDRLYDVGIPGPVQVMESSGGVMSSSHAARRAVFTIESGPAASVVAALQVGRACGIDNLIAFDMGGTTAKAALVRDGRADITHTFHVGGKGSFGGRSGTGMPVKVPAIDLAEVGAGGGSIAWVDPGGALRVGPRSAGAEPGPAAYDRGGTEPTVTDANLLLGYLDPGSFAGGTMSLRPELAARAMGELCRQLGADEPVVAQAIHQIVNANMAAAVDVVTVQRGVDPTKFALFASGGAGPMHVARIAEHFGISKVVVPAASGVASAVGLLGTDLTVENVRTYPAGAEPEAPAVLAEVFAELAVQGAGELSVDPSAAGLVREAFVDMRYRGQSYELTVPAPFSPEGYEDVAAIQKAFFRAYEQAYGIPHDAPTEIVTLRVRVTQRVPRVDVVGGSARAGMEAESGSGGRPAPAARRRAYFEELGGFAEVDVFNRERLVVGDSLTGPAIVEEPEATLIVPPAWSGTVDEAANLVLRRDYPEEGR